MNETDRTIVGLLWHENIIDYLHNDKDKVESIQLYNNILDNICFADYIDRITFQKQIWQFNEMSSLIKTFYNNKLLHNAINENKIKKQNVSEIRFTKILTKYSTEYNNSIFIQNLCQKFGFDKKDLFLFFLDLKEKYTEQERYELLDNIEISKLDINRIYRYLDNFIYSEEHSDDLDNEIIC